MRREGVPRYAYYLLTCFWPSVLWRCWLGGSGGVLMWLPVWSEVQTCIWPCWCHCHSLSLAPVKSRLVSPFWYRLTWVVPDEGPLNGCVVVWLLTCLFVRSFVYQHCWHTMCNRVYATVGRPSVCPYVPSFTAAGLLLCVCQAGNNYRLLHVRRSAANASGASCTAEVGSWSTQDLFVCLFVCVCVCVCVCLLTREFSFCCIVLRSGAAQDVLSKEV